MSPTALERNKLVLFFACFVGLLILLSAYCTERDGFVDEAGFQNPPYMLAHYGQLNFNAYSEIRYFGQPVITHPPVHVGWIGLLERMGLPIYYAEATPSVLLFLLAIFVVVRSAFPIPVKLGWLFSIGFLAATGETLTLCFGTRPEGEVLAAWFCGLVLLDSGRLDNWNRRRLFAGALFLAWASGVHYYAGPALLGVLVYMAWAVKTLGWREARTAVTAMCLGGCLFGLPYLVFYLLPHFQSIRLALSQNQGPGGVGLSIHNHMAMYRSWVQDPQRPALIRTVMSFGLPMWIYSTALLGAVRATRGVALAALPLQLGLFLFAWHKMPYYMVHESVLFAAALAVAILSLCHWLMVRYLPRLVRLFAQAVVPVLCICLVSGSPMLAGARVSAHERVNETEVAQAAGRRILGPHARAGGHWWNWYWTGAEHWYDFEHDFYRGNVLFDPLTYLSNLDAFEDCFQYDEGPVMSRFFADGALKMRGFFFGQSNKALRCVQLGVRTVSPVVGYAEWHDQLYRFQEDPAGGYEVLSAICPANSPDWNQPWVGAFATSFGYLDYGANHSEGIGTMLAPRAYMAPAGPVGRGCRDVARIRGALVLDDRRALVDWARRNDAPVHIYRGLEDMPGYTGVGLTPDAVAPAGAVSVPDIVDLPAVEPIASARIERRPVLRVTTVGTPGAFSAMIPVKRSDTVAGPSWVVLTIQVRQGRVGFGAYTRTGLVAQTLGIFPSVQPQSVALKVADFRSVTGIVVFNQTTFEGIADLLGVSVVVAPEAAAAGGNGAMRTSAVSPAGRRR